MKPDKYDYVSNWHDVLHADVLRVLRDLYELYEHATDSTLDEFSNELDCILDPEYAESFTRPAFLDDGQFPNDVESRNWRTEIMQYSAIRANLSTFDNEVLHMIPDVWVVAENDDVEFQTELFKNLFTIADFIERNKL